MLKFIAHCPPKGITLSHKKTTIDNSLLYQKTIEEIITKYGNKYL